MPATMLLGSPFENVTNSSLWASTQLGMEGKAIYERLASLAALGKNAEEPVWASRRYIASRLGYQVTQTTITRRLSVMASLGLVTLSTQGLLHRVHLLTDEQVEALEASWEHARRSASGSETRSWGSFSPTPSGRGSGTRQTSFSPGSAR